MVIEKDKELSYDSFLGDETEALPDITSPPDDLVTFSGADRTGGSANHTTSGRARGRNAPPYSYASAISSARTGSRVPPSTNSAISLTYPSYFEQGVGTENAWAPASGSGSGSGSSSMTGSDNLSGFSFSGENFVGNRPLLQQQYGQGETQSSFNEFVAPLATQGYAQTSFNLPSNSIWGGDIGFDDVGDGGGMAGFSMSPVSGVSHSGSFIDGSTGSPDVSGESEINFNGTAGLAHYGSAASSSAPASPLFAQPQQQHDKRRVKKPKTGTSTAAAARDDSNASVTASSSAGGGGKGKQTKRELRSASRTSKNAQQRVSETVEERKSRHSHNLVEKQYRNRLNGQFESLLHSLPETIRSSKQDGEGAVEPQEGEASGGPDAAGDKRVSKAEVLEMARRHIKTLEEDRDNLETERDELQANFERLRQAYADELAREGRSLGDEEFSWLAKQ